MRLELPESKLTDAEQAALTKAGTEEARVALVMDNIRQGFAYGRSYCRNRFDDGELLSIVYKAMMAAAVRFRLGKQTLVAFSKAFIRGELHRAWSRKKSIGLPLSECYVHSSACGPDDEEPAVIEPNFEHFDFDEVDRNSMRDRIRPFLGRLTKHEKVVVDLLFFGGYSQSDAARLLGVERRAVGQALRRALDRLRKLMT